MQEFPLWDESSLVLLIAATRRRIRQVVGRLLQPCGVSPQQYTVLMVLSERPGLSLRELAELVWVDNPTASRILKNLIARNLVKAESDPGHGRRLRLGLTDAGEGLVWSLKRVRRDLLEGLEAGLTEEESCEIRVTLEKLLRNLADMEARGSRSNPALSGGVR